MERKNNIIPVSRDADQDAFLTRIIVPRIARSGENIHRYSIPKSFSPTIEKYPPTTEVSLLARNMSALRVMRIPHARIFWSSIVIQDWREVFLLGMAVLYRKYNSMQKEREIVLNDKIEKSIDNPVIIYILLIIYFIINYNLCENLCLPNDQIEKLKKAKTEH